MDRSGVELKERNEKFAEYIPETFREKQWVKDILLEGKDHSTEVFSQFENLQKKLGERVANTGLQVPGDDAPPEAVKAFHKALGVPDSVDAYKLEPAQFEEADKNYAEYLQQSRPEGFMNDLKQAALEAGVTPKTLQALLHAHDRAFIKHHREFIAEQIKAEEEHAVDFENLADSTFGADKPRVIENAKKLIGECLPADSPWRVMLNRLGDPSVQITSNQAAILLAGFAEGFRQKYIAEDSGVKTAAGVQFAGVSNPREEARKLMRDKAYYNELDPNYANLRRQVRELYEMDNAMKGGVGKK